MEKDKILWHTKPLHSFLCVGCSSPLRLRQLCVQRSYLQSPDGYDYYWSWSTTLAPLRSSTSIIIVLTQNGKIF